MEVGKSARKRSLCESVQVTKKQKITPFFAWSMPHVLLCSAGLENGDVLPADEACGQSHPVHPQQGEAEGDQIQHKPRGGGQRAQHGRDGLLASEQRGLHDVRLLVPERLVDAQPLLAVSTHQTHL